MRICQLLIFVVVGLQYCSGQIANQSESKEIISNQKIITRVDTKDSLSISGVKAIPLDVFERTELKYLSIWGQDCDIAGIECYAISGIPKEIENLKNLEELHLTLNYITTLPLEILELKNLKVLDLTENPGFNDIEKVSQMFWLEKFDCFGCQLSEADLEKLRINLPNCKIGTE